jgi:hypothetical protein
MYSSEKKTLFFEQDQPTRKRKTFQFDHLAKRLKEKGSRHSGQAKRDPESRIFKQFWIPAFAGMTEEMTFSRGSSQMGYLQSSFFHPFS